MLPWLSLWWFTSYKFCPKLKSNYMDAESVTPVHVRQWLKISSCCKAKGIYFTPSSVMLRRESDGADKVWAAQKFECTPASPGFSVLEMTKSKGRLFEILRLYDSIVLAWWMETSSGLMVVNVPQGSNCNAYTTLLYDNRISNGISLGFRGSLGKILKWWNSKQLLFSSLMNHNKLNTWL